MGASFLEKVLRDKEVAPGWWSVAREAQAIILSMRNNPSEQEQLQSEVRRVLQDPNVYSKDRRWAECYSRG
jgi:hypothetical protein